MPQLPKREIVIDAAITLFKKNGINATGVDRIIDEAKVSKKTLYNHFKTKDELVLAALRKDDELGRNALMGYASSASDDPLQQVLAIFDFYTLWFNSPNFSGCLFTNSAPEISEDNISGKRVCAEHKMLIQQFIERLLVKAGLCDAKALATKINLLLEGSIVYAYVLGDRNAAREAKHMAMTLLNVVH